MNLHFDETLGEKYNNKTQKVRVMSESWVAENMFCPCCGNPHLVKLKNNDPVADMKCDNSKILLRPRSNRKKKTSWTYSSACRVDRLQYFIF